MTATTTAPDRAEISRQNGRKSRGGGPKTPEGKARSRMNALKHGMTASMQVLPGEDLDAFRRRVADFIAAAQPRNAIELAVTEQAALATWKIARGERAAAARVRTALRNRRGRRGPREPRRDRRPGPMAAGPRPAGQAGSRQVVVPLLDEGPARPLRPRPGRAPAHRAAAGGQCRRLPVADRPVGQAPGVARPGRRLADQRADRGPATARPAAVGEGCHRVARPGRADPAHREPGGDRRGAASDAVAVRRRPARRPGRPAGGALAAGGRGDGAAAPAPGRAPAARGGRPGRAGRPAGGGHLAGRGADAAVPAR